MRIFLKISLIIVVFLIGGLFITLIGEATGNTKGGGLFGIVIMFGLIAAAGAIWKYKPKDKDNDFTANKEKKRKDL